MGLEAKCTARLDGRTSGIGKAYLETDHLRFSGDFRVRMPLSTVRRLDARDGLLIAVGPEGSLELELGSAAAKWLNQIRNPKPLLEKLGVMPDSRVAVIGLDDADFRVQLGQRGILRPDRRLAKGSYDLIFVGAAQSGELGDLAKARAGLTPTGAIWIVYPKGRKDFGEADVRRLGLAAGLVDTKVVSFSATHTGLRWVVPKSERDANRSMTRVATRGGAAPLPPLLESSGTRAKAARQRPPKKSTSVAGVAKSRAKADACGRLFLIHWNETEAKGLAAPLREAGWHVEIEASDGARGGKAILADPPDVVVVYLRRLPSHGRRTAQYLRETRAGRGIPIVFVDGEGEALDKTKLAVSDAVFTTHGRLRQALRRFAKRG